jgi:hypothetical protein
LLPNHYSEFCVDQNNMKIFEYLSNSKNMLFDAKKLLNVGVNLTVRYMGEK